MNKPSLSRLPIFLSVTVNWSAVLAASQDSTLLYSAADYSLADR